MINIGIFASGNGSNAENIIEYFKGNEKVRVSLILSNNSDAFVLDRAKKFKIPVYVFNRQILNEREDVLKKLKEFKIDFVVLSGFMLKVPAYILKAFPNKIINIHPALLPKYGGKGMYGSHVHEAVIRAGENESGISIHYVNEFYDEGQIIFQAKCNVDKKDNPETLANKIHKLEYEYFPKIIEEVILKT